MREERIKLVATCMHSLVQELFKLMEKHKFAEQNSYKIF
jgi:hypothetical protein